MVRVLTTLTKPDAGRALVAGHDVVRQEPRAEVDRLRPAGGRRPRGDRPREPAAPGPDPGRAARRAPPSRRRAPRPRRDRGRRRPGRPRLRRRDETAAPRPAPGSSPNPAAP